MDDYDANSPYLKPDSNITETKADLSTLDPNATTSGSFPDVGGYHSIAASLLVLLVGVAGNLLLVLAFSNSSWKGKAQVLDRIVTVIGVNGFLTTLVSIPVHLYAAVTGKY